SLLPFEIVTDYVESERDAQAAVQTWLKRSYKAYYEPVVVERTPVFRVKLWGYETEAGARDAAALIKKKYNVAAEVE
ncbi:MAG: SPOR domain-containing protein, partial [Candidatus Kapaibacterium sp.]